MKQSHKLILGALALIGGGYAYHRHEHPTTPQTVPMGQGYMLNVTPLIQGQSVVAWALGKNGAIVASGNAQSLGDAKAQARAAMSKAVG